MGIYSFEPLSIADKVNALHHHGIQGQKWGDRNGPPYPLKRSQMSSEEKRSEPKQGYYVPVSAIAYIAAYSIIGLALASYAGIDQATTKSRDKKYTKERNSAPKDKKTGLPLITDKTRSEKEELKRVNPGAPYKDGTSNNCVNCSMATELRKKGYDVAAHPTDEGFGVSKIKSLWPKAKFVTVSKTDSYGNANLKAMRTKAIQEIEKQPEGSRGYLGVTWSGSFSGHAMNYDIKNGKMRIIDGQSGKIYKNPKEILDMASDIYYMRLDNQEPDWKKIKGALI